jgi:phosphate transport system substrate-binding protein
MRTQRARTRLPRLPSPLLLTTALAVVGVTASGCWSTDSAAGSDDPDAAPRSGQLTLTGAGATFPFPIYSRWFSVYNREYGVRINYQSIGSGGGIRQMIEGTVEFGATDAPLTEEDLERIPGTLSIPTVLGAVVLTYNLPGLETPLRLDGETIAAIFLGEIRRWRDPRILALNPGTDFPDRDIIPVHRSDGSGTTYVFTDYLGTVSPAWRNRVGTGNAVRWPTGLGARGNEGVTGQVRQAPGGIGYVEQVFARQNNLPMAEVLNPRGEFVSPSIAATTAAAAGLSARVVDDDFRLSIVNADAEGAYPISSWTYLLIAPHMRDCGRASALLEVIRWALLEGEQDVLDLNYAPLSGEMRVLALNALKRVTCGADNLPVFDPDRDFAAEFVALGGDPASLQSLPAPEAEDPNAP